MRKILKIFRIGAAVLFILVVIGSSAMNVSNQEDSKCSIWSEIRYDASTWNIETVDSEGDVGSYTSLALDSNNYPHISYAIRHELTDADLKYAKWDGTAWIIETVESEGNVGYFTSIAIDSNDYPHISYLDNDPLTRGLKYARWNGSEWIIETVDSEGSTGFYTSLAIDSNDYPHISYWDVTNYDLKYARWDGSSWNIETVDSGRVGEYTSLAIDSNDCPHISYQDAANFDLKYARWTGSEWINNTVDSYRYCGEHTSIALDSNDYPHISYHVDAVAELRYARWTGSEWINETVDDSENLLIECYTSLALDSNDCPHIGYSDYYYGDLKYARWDGTIWDIETVDSEGYVGEYTSLSLDSNNFPHISYFDYSNADLKYAKVVDNNVPDGPEIYGPEEGIVGEEQMFTIVAEDPDGNDLTYVVYWNYYDETFYEYGPFPSGQEFEVSHIWEETGVYYISVIAVDEYGAESEETFHIIEIKEPTKLNITSIKGGLGVTVTIENTAEIDAKDIEWKIHVEGGIFGIMRKTVYGTVDIEANESVTVSTEILFGLGGIDITVEVGEKEEALAGIQIIILTLVG